MAVLLIFYAIVRTAKGSPYEYKFITGKIVSVNINRRYLTNTEICDKIRLYFKAMTRKAFLSPFREQSDGARLHGNGCTAHRL